MNLLLVCLENLFRFFVNNILETPSSTGATPLSSKKPVDQPEPSNNEDQFQTESTKTKTDEVTINDDDDDDDSMFDEEEFETVND